MPSPPDPCCWNLLSALVCGQPAAGTVFTLDGITCTGGPLGASDVGACMVNINAPFTGTVNVAYPGYPTQTYPNISLSCCGSKQFSINPTSICVTSWCGGIYTCEATVTIKLGSTTIASGITDPATGCFTVYNLDTTQTYTIIIESDFPTITSTQQLHCGKNAFNVANFPAVPPPTTGFLTDNNGTFPVCWNTQPAQVSEPVGWVCYQLTIASACFQNLTPISYQISCGSTAGILQITRTWGAQQSDPVHHPDEYCYASGTCSSSAICCKCGFLCGGTNFGGIAQGNFIPSPCDVTCFVSGALSPAVCAGSASLIADPVGGDITFSL